MPHLTLKPAYVRTLSALLAGTALSFPAAVFAQSVAWDGSESTDYNTAGNWTNNTVPSDATSVTIATDTNAPVIEEGQTGLARSLAVGAFDGASLTVGPGGTLRIGTPVNGGSLTVAGSNSGNGTVRATGAGASITVNGGNLDVARGQNSRGLVEILDGARLSSRASEIGTNVGSSGTVTVSGAGSRWDVIGTGNGGLFLGSNAATTARGTLNVLDGAAVVFAGPSDSLNAINGSAVNVIGANSLLRLSGALTSRNGTFTVASGGLAEADSLRIDGFTGLPDALVSVDGGQIKINRGVTIGSFSDSTGQLSIANGGVLRAGSLLIGFGNGSRGQLNVDGAGSLFELTSNSAIDIGTTSNNPGGGGDVTIRNGGRFVGNTSRVDLRRGSSLLVSGQDSTFVHRGELRVGGTATITGPGALASAFSLNVGQNVPAGGAPETVAPSVVEVLNGATLRISNGGGFGTGGSSSSAIVRVSGAGSTLDLAQPNGSDINIDTRGSRLEILEGARLLGAANWSVRVAGGLRVSGQGTDASFGNSVFVGTGSAALADAGLIVENNGIFRVNRLATGGGNAGGDGSSVIVRSGGQVFATDFTLSGNFFGGPRSVLLIEGGSVTASTLASISNTRNEIILGGAAGSAPGAVGAFDVGAVSLFNTDFVINHTGTDLVLPSRFGGSSSVIRHLAGTTTLTGLENFSINAPGNYQGETSLTGGTLRVNGSFGNSVHIMTVSNGATLGGTGRIGGNVTIADGTLAPGVGVGNLTFGNNLVLGAASILDFELGTPNGVAGIDSDLITVLGNLTLDGTINVTNVAGFGPGLYRLFDYSGTLTDNGLAFGSVPSGFATADLSVVTATARQVNLLVAAPTGTFGFWDGAATTPDGIIGGGSGTWRADTTNWTNTLGSTNGIYDPDLLLIFAGTPGTVTVDNAAGPVVLGRGAQFAVDGYNLTGGALALASESGTVRVGDGTQAGAGFTATIANALTGNGAIVKTDLGRLVLSGQNTFAGLTVESGTVQIGNNSALGTGLVTVRSGAMLESGRTDLNITNDIAIGPGAGASLLVRDGETATLEGMINGGSLIKSGGGSLFLRGNNTFDGLTVTSGVVQIGSNSALGTGVVNLLQGATLETRGRSNPAAPVVANTIAIADNGEGATFHVISSETFSGPITGGLLTKTGGATLSLTGNNTFAGLTVISGAVAFSTETALGSGTVTLQEDRPGSQTPTTLISNAPSLAIANAISLVGAGRINVGAANILSLSGPVSGSGALVKLGAGTLVLNGTNTFDGLGISDGIVRISGDAAAGSGTITISGFREPDGILQSGAANITLANEIQTDRFGRIDVRTNETLTLNGNIRGVQISAPTGSLTKIGEGTLVLNGFNSSSGLTVDSGTVRIGRESAPGQGGIVLAGGTTLQSGAANMALSNAIAVSGDASLDVRTGEALTLTGIISGTGAVSKSGSGTLTLAGASTFSGATAVEAGTLNVTGSLAGPVNLGAGATLSGSGSIAGAVNVAGGILSPGSIGAVGTLSVGSLALSANSVLDFQLGVPNALRSSGIDFIRVGSAGMPGDLTLDGILNVTNVGGFGAGFYQLIDYTGTLTDNGLTIGTVPSSFLPQDLSVQTGTPGQVNLLVATPVGNFGFWDGAGTVGNNVIDGGTGTWSASGTNWTIADGSRNGIYDPAQFLIFDGRGNSTVTIDSSAGAVSLGNGAQFARSGYNVSGGALRLDADQTTIRVGNGTALSTSFVTTIDSVLTGPGGLTKTDLGRLILTGTNTFTGDTRISAGIVRVGNNSAFGTGTIFLEGMGTLEAGDTPTVLNNRVVTTGAGIIDTRSVFATLGSLTLNGNISGPGGITTDNNGDLVLNGNNSFSGGLNIDGVGVVVQVGSNTAAGSGTITINPNSRLQSGGEAVTLANDLHIVASQFSDALILVRPNETLTLNGNIGGNGRLTYQDGGTLVLNGQNSFSGLRSEGGTLRLGSNTAAGSGQIILGQVGNRSELRLQSGGANVTIANDILAGSGSRIVDVRPNEVFTLNGTISGTAGTSASRIGQIIKTGAGTLVLNGANTFDGLTISEGVVALGSNTAAGARIIRLTGEGSTLASRGTNISLSNDISFIESGRVVISNGETLTLHGALSGDLRVVKNGGGTLVLDGFRNTTSGLTVGEGIVRIGTQAAVGNGLIEIGRLGTLQSGGSDVVLTNNLFVSSTDISVNRSTFDVRNNEILSLTGRFTANSTVFKSGQGTLALNSSSISIEDGIAVFDGTLRIGVNLSSAAGNISFRPGTILQSGARTTTIDSNIALLSRQNDIPGQIQIDTRPDEVLFLNGVISGTASIVKTGTGALVLNGVSTSTRNLDITAGEVVGSANSLRFRNIVNNGILQIDQRTEGSLSAVLSGSGFLAKNGTGAITLSAESPLSGATSVGQGKLVITGSLSQSTVRVRSGAILGGNGRVGRLIVDSGGRVEPGLSPGTLTVDGDFDLQAGAVYAAELSTTGHDLIVVNGNANIAGDLELIPLGGFSTFNTELTLISATSTIGSFANVIGLDRFGEAFAPVLTRNGASVTLRLAPASLSAKLGDVSGGNALAVASALDQSVTAGYNPQSLFALYNQGSNLSAALGQLSGEIHSAGRRVLLQDARVVRDAALDRLGTGSAVFGIDTVTQDSGETAVTAWNRVSGSGITADADGTGSGFTTDQTAVMTGLDLATKGLRIGAMFHHSASDLALAGSGTAELSGTGGAVYAGWWQDNGPAIGVGGSITGNSARSIRSVRFPGFDETLNGRVESTTNQLFGEAAYDLAAADNALIAPFVRLAHTRVASEALDEVGGAAALSAERQSVALTQTSAGLRASYSGKTIALSGSASWQRSSGARDAATNLGFTGAGAAARIVSAALDRDMAALDLQARLALNRNVTIGAGYSGLIGRDTKEHGARATLTIGF